MTSDRDDAADDDLDRVQERIDDAKDDADEVMPEDPDFGTSQGPGPDLRIEPPS